MKISKWSLIPIAILSTGGLLFAKQTNHSLVNLDEHKSYTLKEVLAGEVIPVILKTEQLPPEFRIVELESESSTSPQLVKPDRYETYYQNGQESDSRYSEHWSLTFGSYTSGQNIKIDGITYYVTYRKDFQGPDLRLNLVRVDTVHTIVVLDQTIPKASGKSSAQVEALNRIKQAALATIMYENDYDDCLPIGQSTEKVVDILMPYSKNHLIFESPNSGGKFLYNVHVSGRDSSKISDPSSLPIWKEVLPNLQDEFAVAFLDGHALTEPATKHWEIESRWNHSKAATTH